ncbi:MAG: DeoR/GlpR transcriptional regulator [Clostridia bacterium]|nr:DeoR/GlpR transcriptional regulator [Clostridia bacterium]
MAHKDRESAILEYLQARGECSVGELCRALFVSEPTMRRDLGALNAAGKIIRTHGGAAPRSTPGENLPQAYREREQSEAKLAIGKRCLSLIRDGDTIMVDGSSTAQALLRVIGSKTSLVVVTNHAKAPELVGEGKVKLFVTGGEPAPNAYAYVGSHAEEFFRQFHADICFFSVRRLTSDGRLTDNALAENAVRRAMLAASGRRVLMLDSKKLGEPCMHTLCRLEEITHVVSERDISASFPAYREKFLCP